MAQPPRPITGSLGTFGSDDHNNMNNSPVHVFLFLCHLSDRLYLIFDMSKMKTYTILHRPQKEGSHGFVVHPLEKNRCSVKPIKSMVGDRNPRI